MVRGFLRSFTILINCTQIEYVIIRLWSWINWQLMRRAHLLWNSAAWKTTGLRMNAFEMFVNENEKYFRFDFFNHHIAMRHQSLLFTSSSISVKILFSFSQNKQFQNPQSHYLASFFLFCSLLPFNRQNKQINVNWKCTESINSRFSCFYLEGFNSKRLLVEFNSFWWTAIDPIWAVYRFVGNWKQRRVRRAPTTETFDLTPTWFASYLKEKWLWICLALASAAHNH